MHFLIDQTEKLLGVPSITINNAAYITQSDIDILTALELDIHYHLNLKATILLSLGFVKRFKAQKHGRISNLTTGQSEGAKGTKIDYTLTKAVV